MTNMYITLSMSVGHTLNINCALCPAQLFLKIIIVIWVIIHYAAEI